MTNKQTKRGTTESLNILIGSFLAIVLAVMVWAILLTDGSELLWSN